MNPLRRLWGKHFVKLTRRVGEDEVLEISFNEHSEHKTTARLHHLLDFLDIRRDDHNRKVLELVKKAHPK